MIRRWFLRPLSITIFLFLSLLVIVNYISYKPMPENPAQQTEIWLDLQQYRRAEPTIRAEINDSPLDLDAHFRYLRTVFLMPESEWPLASLEARYSTFLISDETKNLGHWGKAWIHLYQNNPQAAVNRFSLMDETPYLPHTNLGLGKAYLQLGKIELAKKAFQTEIINGGNWQEAAREVFSLYVYLDQMELAQDFLITNPSAAAVVDQDDLRRMAFSLGDWDLYLEKLLFQPFRSIHVFAILSSLFIAAIWFFYFWRIDIFEQEPIWISLFVVILGGLMTVISVFASDSLLLIYPLRLDGTVVNDLIYSIAQIGLLEELFKFVPVLVAIYIFKQVNEPVDAIIYASLSALGFATVENIVVISAIGEKIMIARLLVATLMHLASTSIFAYIWSFFRFIRQGDLKLAWFLGWIMAGTVHGIFDYLILSPASKFALAPFLMMIFTVWIYGMMLRNSLNFSPFFNNPTFTSKRLVNYEWILSAGWWVLLMGYAYFYMLYSSEAANAWMLGNLWTTLPIVLGIFAALGELSLSKGKFVFP